MQPYFFPYIGYFQLIHKVDKFLLYDRVSFIKKSWINRNYIINKGNFQQLQLTIPIENKSSNSLIAETKINNNKDWRTPLLKSVQMNYRKAPFFNSTYPIIEDIIQTQCETISEFNKQCIIKTCNHIGITTEISTDEAYYEDIESNLKNKSYSLHDSFTQVKAERIFQICKMEKATKYLNPIGGVALYSKDLFAKNKIELKFLKSSEIKYDQFKNTFIPNLSILDVMMFNSKDSILKILNHCSEL